MTQSENLLPSNYGCNLEDYVIKMEDNVDQSSINKYFCSLDETTLALEPYDGLQNFFIDDDLGFPFDISISDSSNNNCVDDFRIENFDFDDFKAFSSSVFDELVTKDGNNDNASYVPTKVASEPLECGDISSYDEVAIEEVINADTCAPSICSEEDRAVWSVPNTNTESGDITSYDEVAVDEVINDTSVAVDEVINDKSIAVDEIINDNSVAVDKVMNDNSVAVDEVMNVMSAPVICSEEDRANTVEDKNIDMNGNRTEILIREGEEPDRNSNSTSDETMSEITYQNSTNNDVMNDYFMSMFPRKKRSERKRYDGCSWTCDLVDYSPTKKQRKRRKKSQKMMKKCSHCQTTQTPQWRNGPLGRGTLCNACGVRYKVGKLCPEYRPAASPSFTIGNHSNFHKRIIKMKTGHSSYELRKICVRPNKLVDGLDSKALASLEQACKEEANLEGEMIYQISSQYPSDQKYISWNGNQADSDRAIQVSA